jgi:EAL domain-containing protein (putative c-di-GMP-specific phosphodiesterase class I)
VSAAARRFATRRAVFGRPSSGHSETLIALGHNRALEVVAEGVDTDEQIAFLESMAAARTAREGSGGASGIA